MAIFTRNIIGIVLLVSLSAMIGCSTLKTSNSTTSANKTASKPNIFSKWQKPKEPEGARKEAVADFLSRERVSSF